MAVLSDARTLNADGTTSTLSGGGGGAPSGPAGGVLSGSYPNPAFALDMATQAELDAVASAKQDASTAATDAELTAHTGRTDNPHSVTKSQVGLGSADNTADTAKPVSTAQQTALDGKQPLDSDLTAVAGIAPSNDDVIQRKAGAWTNRTMGQVKTDLALVKGDVGLGNVDNTSDTAKPVSTAQQTALDGKQGLDTDLTAIAALTTTAYGRGFLDLADAAAARTKMGAEASANKGAVSGYAGLDAATKVPTAQLGGAGADATKFLRGDQTWAAPTVAATPIEQLALMQAFPLLIGATAPTAVRTLTPTGLGATVCQIFPFAVAQQITVNQVLMQTVAAVANSIQLGIFNSAGTRVWTSGAQSTVAGNMAVTASLPLVLTPGTYYFGVTNNNAVSAVAAYQTTPAFTAATVPRWGTVSATLGAMPASITPSGITETVGGFMAYVTLSNWTT